jgi:hypothetical protein
MKTVTRWLVPGITGYKILTNYWNKFTEAEQETVNPKDVSKMAKLLKTIEGDLCTWNYTQKNLLPYQKLQPYQKEVQRYAKYFTELVMVLNHKCWDHYEIGNFEVSNWYTHQYQRLTDWAYEHMDGENLSYFARTLD